MKGRASTIEDLGDGRLLRRGGNPVREAVVMEHARRHGYPVPEVHEVRGDALVLEKVDGPTMQEDIQLRPWLLARHMRTLAGLHHRLHEIEHPEGGTLLHLDLHSANVIRTSGVPIASRLAARLFIRHFDAAEIAAALPAACDYRIADPHTFPRERERVARLRRRYG